MVDGNQLTGTIPTELGLLDQLGHVFICEYSTNVVIFSFGGLCCGGCNILFPTFHYFIAALTQLTGTIPTEFGLLTKLTKLYLCKCSCFLFLTGCCAGYSHLTSSVLFCFG